VSRIHGSLDKVAKRWIQEVFADECADVGGDHIAIRCYIL
jgi:hypothetical protein